MFESYFDQWDEFVILRDAQINETKFRTEQDKFVLALFARINTISNDIVTLAKLKQFSSSRILMRSAIETFVDLKCLVDDSEYLEYMKNAELASEIKYRNHFSLNNKYYSEEYGEKKMLDQLKAAFDSSKNLNAFQRFEKAGEIDAYRTVYNNLCLFSHGNISAMASDNFENGHIVLNRIPEDTTLKFIMSGTIKLAIGATLETLAYFKNEEAILKPFEDFLGKSQLSADSFK